ncbi:MAG: hypothetical protein AB7T49_01000 [Oligoflexales bacterium]
MKLALCFGWFVSILSITSLVLTRAGVFTSPRALLATALILVFYHIIARGLEKRNGSPTADGQHAPWGWPEWLNTTLIMGACILNGCFPVAYVRAGRDYGNYLLQAVVIDRRGSLDLNTDVLAPMNELVARLGAIMTPEFPAIYRVKVGGVETLVPQFLQLFPALAANAHRWMGINGILWVNPVLSALGLVFVGMLLARLPKASVRIFAVLALLLNAAFLYNSRIPNSECLSFFLTFFGLFLLFGRKTQHALHGCAGGFILGLGQFNRLDSFLTVLLFLPWAFTLGEDVRDRKKFFTALAMFCVTTSLGFLDSYTFSGPYTGLIFDAGLRWLLLACCCVAILSVGVALGLRRFLPAWFQNDKYVRRTAIVLTSIWALWVFRGFFLYSPDAWERSLRSRALNEVAFYTTRTGIVLSIFGLWQVLSKRVFILWPAVGLLIGATLCFTFDPAVAPDHFWATRRWVPQVFPGVAILAAIGLAYVSDRLSSRFGRLMGLGVPAMVLALWVQNAIHLDRPYIFHKLGGGIVEGYEAGVKKLKQELKAGEVLLTRNSDIASILTYVYQVPTFLINADNSRELKPYLSRLHGMRFVDMDPFAYQVSPEKFLASGCGPFVSGSIGTPPSRLTSDWCVNLFIGRFPDVADAFPTISVPGSYYGLFESKYFEPSRQILDFRKPSVETTGKIGIVHRSPWISLDPGGYRLTYYGKVLSASDSPSGRIEVAAKNGDSSLIFQNVQSGEDDVIAQLLFEVGPNDGGILFQYHAAEGGRVRIDKVELGLRAL